MSKNATPKFYFIAELILAIRNKSGLSQKLFSEKIGYKNGQFISNVERALCPVPAKTQLKISEVFNVAKENLLDASTKDYEAILKKKLEI